MATDLTALTANLGLSITAKAEKGLDLSTPKSQTNIAKTLALAFGTGANKADQIWHDRSILAASASNTLDLAGALINAFGSTVTFANLKAIAIINRSDEVLTGHSVATDAVISIAPGTAGFVGPFADPTDQVNIPPGGVFLLTNPTAAGWAVTAGTLDEIDITNEDAVDQAIYDVLFIGESA